MPGTTSRMTWPDPVRTTGVKMVWPASATTTSCCALAWPYGMVDPILKERVFGLTNSEANHGEDVKEYYFYLDANPFTAALCGGSPFPWYRILSSTRDAMRLPKERLSLKRCPAAVLDERQYSFKAPG